MHMPTCNLCWIPPQIIRPNKKYKCVLGNRSEHFRVGRDSYFLIIFSFWKNIIFAFFTFQNVISRKPEKISSFLKKKILVFDNLPFCLL